MKLQTEVGAGARVLTKLLGSRWAFRLTLLIFTVEAGWQALMNRFPMAYDEAYHFGLIRFFSYHLNPIITAQTPDTYRFGALIQGTSFLYHYILSFPYRLIVSFTGDAAIQVIGLRFINIALALAGLLIIRKLLRLINVSDALANLVALAFALTPLFTVLAGQINYDNLLIPAVSACVYALILLMRQFDKGGFDSKRFLLLLSLCLFSSLIKFAFLPIFAVMMALVAWKTFLCWRTDKPRLLAGARRSFAGMGRHTRLILVAACILGGFLFARVYGVNLIRYHNPAPACDQVLSVKDCEHYYSWSVNRDFQDYTRTHHVPRWNMLRYDAYWLTVSIFEPFSVLTPLQGHIYAFTAYLVVMGLIGSIALICTAVNLKRILRDRDLAVIAVVCAVYIFSLWSRNYHDYLQIGWPRAIHGRYLLPIWACLYILLASGVRYGLENRRNSPAIKAVLALAVAASFVYYGGSRQYEHFIYPKYGRIDSSNVFTLQDAAPE